MNKQNFLLLTTLTSLLGCCPGSRGDNLSAEKTIPANISSKETLVNEEKFNSTEFVGLGKNEANSLWREVEGFSTLRKLTDPLLLNAKESGLNIRVRGEHDLEVTYRSRRNYIYLLRGIYGVTSLKSPCYFSLSKGLSDKVYGDESGYFLEGGKYVFSTKCPLSRVKYIVVDEGSVKASLYKRK